MRAAGHVPVGLRRGGQGLGRPHPLAPRRGCGRSGCHRCPRRPDRRRRPRPGVGRRVGRPGRRRALPAGRRGRLRGERDRDAETAPGVGLLPVPRRAGQPLGPGRAAPDAASHRPRHRLLRGGARLVARAERLVPRVHGVLRDRRAARIRGRVPLVASPDRRPAHGRPARSRAGRLGRAPSRPGGRAAGPGAELGDAGRGSARGRQPGRAVTGRERLGRLGRSQPRVPSVGQHSQPAGLLRRARRRVDGGGGGGPYHRDAGARPQRAFHGHGEDGRRPRHLGRRPVVGQSRHPEPGRGRRQRVRDRGRGEPDVDDHRPRPACR